MLGDSLLMIRAVRPAMTLLPRVVVEAVLLSEGSIGSAEAVARQLGVPNRFTLARILKREGLLPLHRLAEWATLESWLRAWEQHGVSLCRLAFRSGRHPSACYRLVKELTGLRWTQLRARGLHWLRRQFAKRVKRQTRIDRVDALRVVVVGGERDARPGLVPTPALSSDAGVDRSELSP